MASDSADISRRSLGKLALAAAATGSFAAGARAAPSGEPIKVGILHSLSGTMAISETTLKDVMLMLIAEQNAKGGVLGRPLQAVVVDPASNWPLFAEKARQLISVDKCAAVFGCWTSVDYLAREEKIKRWVLAGTDYVYPRTTNQILENYLLSKGVPHTDIMINYTPFGQSDWQNIVAQIKGFGSAGKKTAVVSTINGDANVPFYKELGNQGIKATDIPVCAFSVGEEELAGMDTHPLVGHLAAWNYFESVNTKPNKAFIKAWHKFTKNPKRTTNDPMEAHYIGFNMWVQAVTKAGSTAPDTVIDTMVGIKQPNLTGGIATMLPNHHLTKPVLIGEIQDDGQFNVVWKTPNLVAAEAWSPYVPETKNLIGDWSKPISCGNYNTVKKVCVGKQHA
jgi:urea transport system substrate-binding protein